MLRRGAPPARRSWRRCRSRPAPVAITIVRPSRADRRGLPAHARRAPRGARAGQEAVVGRGDDAQRRHARALPALQAVAVLHAVCAAGVVRGFGDAPAPGSWPPSQYTGERRDDRASRACCARSAGPAGCRRTRRARARQRTRRPAMSARDARAQGSRRGAAGALAAVAVGDRHAPVAAERARGDLDPRRRLAALVLGEVDEADRAVDVVPPAGPAAISCSRLWSSST